MKKFKDRRKHEKRYMLLATVIFVFVGLLHVLRMVCGWELAIDGFAVPQAVSGLTAFIALSMALMGASYYFIKD